MFKQYAMQGATSATRTPHSTHSAKGARLGERTPKVKFFKYS